MSRRPTKRDSLIWELVTKPEPVHPPGTPDLVRRDQHPFVDSTFEEAGTLSIKSVQHISSSEEPEVPDEMKWVGGVHQQTNVKLPGYWTHQRAAQLQQLADNEKKRQRKQDDSAGSTIEAKSEHQSKDDADGEVRNVSTDVDDKVEELGFWNAVARCKAWLLF